MIPRAILLVSLLYLAPPQALAASPAAVHRQLVEAGQTTDAYDPLLESFFALARDRGDILAPVQVGGVFASDRINIIVVRAPEDGRGIQVQGLSADQGHLARNFVALNPNLVLLGEHILADVVLNVFNDALGILQALDVAEQDATVTDPINLASSMTTFLRLNNIRHSLDGPKDENHPLSLSPQIVQSVTAAWDGSDEGAGLFYYGLLFIFYHEFAHLEANQSAGFLDIMGMLERWRRQRILAEEERADNEARRLLNAAMSKSRNAMDLFAVLSMASYLRDFMASSLFDDLGPLGVSERFFSFRHRECTPGEGDGAELRTDSIDQVVGGYWNVLPILSNAHVAELQQRLRSQADIATHAHNFLRSGSILADMAGAQFPVDRFAPIVPFVRLYESVIDGRPYILKDTVVGTTSMTLEDLTQGLADDAVSFEPSSVCESPLQCLLGDLIGDAKIEVILSEGRVKYAVLYMPVLWQSAFSPDYAGSEEQTRAYIENVASTIRLFANFLGAGGDVSPQGMGEAGNAAVNLATFMRGQIVQCGFFSHEYRREREVVEITTMSAGSWVRFKVYPATHNIEEFR